MQSKDIRQSFMEFFKSKNHTIVESASLYPESPNLLFTNAGMNQFVPVFLEERSPVSKRIANTQKCIRAGGKHNDLEDVGFDTYHHTFFEMLGNWSFGDYFKKESIEWAWELLTKVWKFPKNRLYATVYKPEAGDPANFDEESFLIWKTIFAKEGMNFEDHIKFFGKKDNFWSMGESGPCGACTEIHIDLTPNGDTKGSLVNTGVPECMEIWNLVFIEFNATGDGNFVPLSKKHVDTGMGFERVSGIVSSTKNFTNFTSVPSNYESDLFCDLFSEIEKLSGLKYTKKVAKNREIMSLEEKQDCAFRVIADHVRTLTFAISDGILPSNEGRGYVLRRILRRSVLFAKRLNLKNDFLVQLSDVLIEKMKSVFPKLSENKVLIQKVLKAEENQFEETLDRGMQVFESLVKNSVSGEKSSISGEKAFLLYDTYGFPLDLTELLARERGLSVDNQGFEAEMEAQRQRARNSQKKTVIKLKEIDDSEPSVFLGYNLQKTENFYGILKQVVNVKSDTFLVFDKTPFYAEMGGQIGDSGVCECENFVFEISDTIHFENQILHKLNTKNLENLNDLVGKQFKLTVDIEKRRQIQRNHTGVHLLHWALREVLGKHVIQAGSLVTDHSFRLDFSHFEAMKDSEIKQIEDLCAQKILNNYEVDTNEIDFNEKPSDCLAIFGEKYGDKVRMVKIGDFSTELCGGTHVHSLNEIGMLKIVSEGSIAAGKRRIEAVVSLKAYELFQNSFKALNEIGQTLSCNREQISKSLENLILQKQELEKSLKTMTNQTMNYLLNSINSKAKKVADLSVIIEEYPISISSENLRSISMRLLKDFKNDLVILASVSSESKTIFVASSSEKAIKTGFESNKILQNLLSKIEGKSGGKQEFAMGSSKTIPNLSNFLDKYISSLN